MDYKKIYNQLVEKAKPRGLDKSKYEGYFEIHHIVPRCMGGGDEKENLVMFTVREHILAHILLWKSYPGNRSIVYAAHMMTGTREGGDRLPVRVLTSLRESFMKMASERVEGAGLGKTRHTDLTGRQYGRLTVMSFDSWHILPDGARRSKWKCSCECGGLAIVARTALTGGGTVSCGCYQKERIKEAVGKWDVSRRTYTAYKNMIGRCYNPKHKGNHKYVKYGIKVCDEWLGDNGLVGFVEDMGEAPDGLCLVRLNPMEDFDKNNCMWVTHAEASRSTYKFPRSATGSTGVVGVTFSKRRQKYVAKMQVNGKYLAREFHTIEEAVAKRKEWEEEYRVSKND